METPVKVDLLPSKFENGLCFNYGEYTGLKIECNHCSRDDYVFSDNGKDYPEEGWMSKAAAHFAEHHTAWLGLT